MKEKKNKAAACENCEEKAAEQAQAEPQEPEQQAPAAEAADESAGATEQEWREALETAVKQRDEYLDSLRRSQAEFQNFRRRNQTARSDGYQEGAREVIASILPVIDNLERALDASRKTGENDPLLSGVEMTLNLMIDGLKKFGLEEIPAEGADFDPELHNAVMREEADEPGKVLEVFQKGYRVKDKIIRYAMVKVSAD